MPFKIVISDPKTRRSGQIDKDAPALIGLKIGDVFEGDVIGAPGFKLEITGGSDKDGFPMRKDVPGASRKRLLLSSGPGYRPLKKGMKKRKNIRGNAISEAVAQINCKVVGGEGDIFAALNIQPKNKEQKT